MQGKMRVGAAGDAQHKTKSQRVTSDLKRLAKLQRGAKHAARSDDAVLVMRKLLAIVGCKLFVRSTGLCGQ